MRRASDVATAALLTALLLVPRAAPASAVSGTITAHPAPEPVPAHVLVDGHACGHESMVYERYLEVGEHGGVAGAVVHVEPLIPVKRKKKPAAGPPLVIDQINCTFTPRVAAIATGTQVVFRNSDPVFHNVHAIRPGKGTVVNMSLPLRGQEAKAFVAKEPGDVLLRCDAGHTWMRADIRVFDHPYFAQTGEDGTYRIEDLAPGKYRLVAWHPELGTREAPLEITGTKDEVSILISF